ncbi:hypothetical protein FHP25_13555 [Vineibacter terrae]|uniref:Capsule polysaccharide biosynthesis protein n=1 Tax=Vineibacter terrae TaxID=2586908 RepID=A0A5C8PNA1_9HYPH|nr:hypothetical protein [Vineibacter terrae]TXL75673.1 hypothetical protein FHP25_13555 [Vineibacter terrae]
MFRQDPSFLLPWVGWIEDIATANPQRRCCVVSNDWLLGHFSNLTFSQKFAISARDALQAHGFRRLRYGKDRVGRAARSNGSLEARLREIASHAKPSVVVSFTENEALKASFLGALVLYTELGCLPRLGAPETMFLDPCGHQTGLLVVAWDRLARMEPPLSTGLSEDLWEAHLQATLREHPAHEAARHWVRELRPRRTRLLALQPPDWLTYEGLYGPVHPEELIYREASRQPDALLVPAYHPGHRLSPDMEKYISGEFPNVVFPPRELSSGRAELFVPYVDEVVTISSTVAMAGILAGKPVRTLGRSAFRRAAAAMTKVQGDLAAQSRLRRNLLAFLSNRYLHLKARLTGESGYASDVVSQIPRTDPADHYFDFSDWTVERLVALLGLGSTVPLAAAPAACKPS